MKIVLASTNSGKIHELRTLLKPFNIEIIPQAELNVTEIPETAMTFVENAIIKARHVCQQTGLPAIADDSGLLVDALRGAPGIYSARFAGEKAKTEDNINKLLSELKPVTKDKRQARFYCALVFLQYATDPTPLICEGVWNGIILDEPLGNKGFGYDPVFFDPNELCSAAELDITKKNQISHRGKALKLLIEKLSKWSNNPCMHYQSRV